MILIVKSVELYEALKPHIGREAAQMIAEVVPPAANLATKEDIQKLRGDLFRWGLTFFVPMWATTLAIVVQLFRA
jgi:hypothetical protein